MKIDGHSGISLEAKISEFKKIGSSMLNIFRKQNLQFVKTQIIWEAQ